MVFLFFYSYLPSYFANFPTASPPFRLMTPISPGTAGSPHNGFPFCQELASSLKFFRLRFLQPIDLADEINFPWSFGVSYTSIDDFLCFFLALRINDLQVPWRFLSVSFPIPPSYQKLSDILSSPMLSSTTWLWGAPLRALPARRRMTPASFLGTLVEGGYLSPCRGGILLFLSHCPRLVFTSLLVV